MLANPPLPPLTRTPPLTLRPTSAPLDFILRPSNVSLSTIIYYTINPPRRFLLNNHPGSLYRFPLFPIPQYSIFGAFFFDLLSLSLTCLIPSRLHPSCRSWLILEPQSYLRHVRLFISGTDRVRGCCCLQTKNSKQHQRQTTTIAG